MIWQFVTSGDGPWWFGSIAAILFFVVFERRALMHSGRNNSLSFWFYSIGQKWPLSIYLAGFVSGGLAVHFFWHWCPSIGAGIG